jgi:hypothetical protein
MVETGERHVAPRPESRSMLDVGAEDAWCNGANRRISRGTSEIRSREVLPISRTCDKRALTFREIKTYNLYRLRLGKLAEPWLSLVSDGHENHAGHVSSTSSRNRR